MASFTVPATVLSLTSPVHAEVALDLGWHVILVRHVRVAFITAPLPGTVEARAAMRFARHHIGPGQRVTITSYFEADTVGDSVVQIRVDGDRDYAAMLFAAGHALAYEGIE